MSTTTIFTLWADNGDGTRSVSDVIGLNGERQFRDMNRCAKRAVERSFTNFQDWLDARGTDRIQRQVRREA